MKAVLARVSHPRWEGLIRGGERSCRRTARAAGALVAFAAICLLAGCGHSRGGLHEWIAFASDRDGRWDVYAIHPDGRGLIRITARRDELSPQLAASRDGSKLAIVSPGGTTVINERGRRTRRAGGDLYAQPYVMDGGAVRLAQGDSAWRSPDGARTAWVDRRGRLWIKTGKSGAVRMVARGVEPAQVIWSPDARLLAFPIARGSRGPHAPVYQVAVARGDGSGLRVLTRSASGEQDAYPNAWSPDSRRLLFVQGYAPAALDQIWSVAPDGSDARALTHAYPAGGENTRPVWFHGVLNGAAVPPPLVRSAGRLLRTRYLVGEVGAASGHVAVLPLPHDPQTPRPSFPLLVWKVATGTTTLWPIPACARPEGLLFDGTAAAFDCNNSCCDSSDESLLVFRVRQPAPLEAATGEGSGAEGGTYLRGYGLASGSLAYGRSLERQGPGRADLWLVDRGGRRARLGLLDGDVVGYAAGRIAILDRGGLDVLDRTGLSLYRLPLPRVKATPESGHFHSPSAQILLGRDLGVALQGARLIVWDAASGRRRGVWPVPPGAFLEGLSGRRAALVSGRAVYVLDLDRGRPTVYHFPAVVINPVGKGTVGFYARTPIRASLDEDRLAVAYNIAPGGPEPGRVAIINLTPIPAPPTTTRSLRLCGFQSLGKGWYLRASRSVRCSEAHAIFANYFSTHGCNGRGPAECEVHAYRCQFDYRDDVEHVQCTAAEKVVAFRSLP